MPRPARVLIVAGSDSGGGAGIQGDIKTATALGAYAMTAVTAVTVQNTNGVSRSFPIPCDVVSEQIQAVMSDIGADAIKTGMLVSGGVIAAVADALKGYTDLPIVVDPVMTAKGGASLLDDPGVHALKAHLFPIAALVTPNIPEAERLTGMHILTGDDMVAAGETLRNFGARAVLVKGGHLSGDTVTDVLVSESGVHRFSAGGCVPGRRTAPVALSPRRQQRVWPRACRWSARLRKRESLSVQQSAQVFRLAMGWRQSIIFMPCRNEPGNSG